MFGKISKKDLVVIHEQGDKSALRGKDLRGLDFTFHLDWDGWDFSGCNLSKANFGGISLGDSNFTKANLTLTNLNRATADGANFFGANLDRAYISDASLRRVVGDGVRIVSLMAGSVHIVIYEDNLSIGWICDKLYWWDHSIKAHSIIKDEWFEANFKQYYGEKWKTCGEIYDRYKDLITLLRSKYGAPDTPEAKARLMEDKYLIWDTDAEGWFALTLGIGHCKDTRLADLFTKQNAVRKTLGICGECGATDRPRKNLCVVHSSDVEEFMQSDNKSIFLVEKYGEPTSQDVAFGPDEKYLIYHVLEGEWFRARNYGMTQDVADAAEFKMKNESDLEYVLSSCFERCECGALMMDPICLPVAVEDVYPFLQAMSKQVFCLERWKERHGKI